MILRIILNWQLLAGPTDAGVHHTGPAVYWQLVQQIMISHYATQGLEVGSYLVSLDRYPNYLHLCSSVYSHSH